jgi:hypothetical protein
VTGTTTKAPPVDPAQIERATALAVRLLQDRHLGKRLPTAAAAIGKALVTTKPGSAHGRLLARTLRPAPGGAARSREEEAVLWLAARSETPTPEAVAAAAQQLANRRARQARLTALAAPFAEADGERAANYVAEVVTETGEGPLWSELGAAWAGLPIP